MNLLAVFVLFSVLLPFATALLKFKSKYGWLGSFGSKDILKNVFHISGGRRNEPSSSEERSRFDRMIKNYLLNFFSLPMSYDQAEILTQNQTNKGVISERLVVREAELVKELFGISCQSPIVEKDMIKSLAGYFKLCLFGRSFLNSQTLRFLGPLSNGLRIESSNPYYYVLIRLSIFAVADYLEVPKILINYDAIQLAMMDLRNAGVAENMFSEERLIQMIFDSIKNEKKRHIVLVDGFSRFSNKSQGIIQSLLCITSERSNSCVESSSDSKMNDEACLPTETSLFFVFLPDDPVPGPGFTLTKVREQLRGAAASSSASPNPMQLFQKSLMDGEIPGFDILHSMQPIDNSNDPMQNKASSSSQSSTSNISSLSLLKSLVSSLLFDMNLNSFLDAINTSTLDIMEDSSHLEEGIGRSVNSSPSNLSPSIHLDVSFPSNRSLKLQIELTHSNETTGENLKSYFASFMDQLAMKSETRNPSLSNPSILNGDGSPRSRVSSKIWKQILENQSRKLFGVENPSSLSSSVSNSNLNTSISANNHNASVANGDKAATVDDVNKQSISSNKHKRYHFEIPLFHLLQSDQDSSSNPFMVPPPLASSSARTFEMPMFPPMSPPDIEKLMNSPHFQETFRSFLRAQGINDPKEIRFHLMPLPRGSPGSPSTSLSPPALPPSAFPFPFRGMFPNFPPGVRRQAIPTAMDDSNSNSNSNNNNINNWNSERKGSIWDNLPVYSWKEPVDLTVKYQLQKFLLEFWSEKIWLFNQMNLKRVMKEAGLRWSNEVAKKLDDGSGSGGMKKLHFMQDEYRSVPELKSIIGHALQAQVLKMCQNNWNKSRNDTHSMKNVENSCPSSPSASSIKILHYSTFVDAYHRFNSVHVASMNAEESNAVGSKLNSLLPWPLASNSMGASPSTSSSSASISSSTSSPSPSSSTVKELMASITDPSEVQLLNEVIFPEDVGVSYDQIGGLNEVKELLRESVSYPLRYPHLYQEGMAAEAVKGVLLFGPPGTGKTMLAKAVATEGGASFLSIDAATLESKWLGESEKNAKAVFSLAKKLSPCVIFIDEIDSILSSRESASDDRSGSRRVLTSMKTTLMQEWDGLKVSTTSSSALSPPPRIIVIASTNRPFDLDEAVLRRLPRRILVDLPDLDSRRQILLKCLGRNVVDPQLNITQVAERMEGYSGSDIREVCREAVVGIAHEQARLLEQHRISMLSGFDKKSVKNEVDSVDDTKAKKESERSSMESKLPRNKNTQNILEDEEDLLDLEYAAEEDMEVDQGLWEVNLRPVGWKDFERALKRLKSSVSENSAEVKKVIEWNDRYGEMSRNSIKKPSFFSMYI